MVADPAIDALWICAPNYTRVEVMEEIAQAVTRGKGELIGVACEKPLGRNVEEARKMLDLAKKANLLDGYLENQVFAPAVTRGKEIVWARGAAIAGPPYLARAAEEHSGPHMPWFWEGTLQGGGVLNDMMCHSVEEARFMLTPPGAPRDVLTPRRSRPTPTASNGRSRTTRKSWPKTAEGRPTISTGRPRTSPARSSNTRTRRARLASSRRRRVGAMSAPACG